MAHASSVKVKRDAFLYLGPKGKPDDHAQCRTCMMWNGPAGENPNRCHIHGPKVEVTGDHTCGFYVNGRPHKAELMPIYTSEESGLEKREVRCENCHHFRRWGGRGRCMMMEALNDELPNIYDLDATVEPMGCCNANVPRVRGR